MRQSVKRWWWRLRKRLDRYLVGGMRLKHALRMRRSRIKVARLRRLGELMDAGRERTLTRDDVYELVKWAAWWSATGAPWGPLTEFLGAFEAAQQGLSDADVQIAAYEGRKLAGVA